VCDYVYEHGQKSGENANATYSYTYSYTRISSRSQSGLAPDKVPANPPKENLQRPAFRVTT